MQGDKMDDMTQEQISKFASSSKYAGIIWNAAIEEAAKCVELTSKFGEMGRMAEEIRKLKK